MKMKKLVSAFVAAAMALSTFSFSVLADEGDLVAYGPYADYVTGDNGIYADDLVFTGPNNRSGLTKYESLGNALIQALTKQGAADIPATAAEMTVGQMQQLSGHLDLSNMGITELPEAGQGSNWPSFEAGMLNVTSIDFSGNTFTKIPYYMFYSQNTNLDGEKTYDGITAITLPDTVEYFEPLCMNSMANLETMNIPANMKCLDSGALAYCPKLTWNINDFPSGVIFGKKSLQSCTNVYGDLDQFFATKSPQFGVVWGEGTYNPDDTNLYSFELTSCTGTAEALAQYEAIYRTALGHLSDNGGITGDLVIPDSIEKVSGWAFDGWAIDSITMSNTTQFDGPVFNRNENLKSVNIIVKDPDAAVNLEGKILPEDIEVTYIIDPAVTGDEDLGALLASAIANAGEGDVIKVYPGDYNIPQDNETMVEGQTGWYLPITKNNITIVGVDEDGNEITDPTLTQANIYSTDYSANGAWPTQNLITVLGDGVTIKGLTIMNKIAANKSLEVVGTDFTIENCKFAPISEELLVDVDEEETGYAYDEYKEYGASLYFSNADVAASVTNNYFDHSGITLDGTSNADITITGNTFNGVKNWNNDPAYTYSTIGYTSWANPPVTDISDASITITENKFIDAGKINFSRAENGSVSVAENYWGDAPQFGDMISGDVEYLPYYLDEPMTELSKVNVIDTVIYGNLEIEVPTVGNMIEDPSDEVTYALTAGDVPAEIQAVPMQSQAPMDAKTVYVDLSVTKDGEEIVPQEGEVPVEHSVNITINEPVNGRTTVYHYDETYGWQFRGDGEGNTVTFNSTFSPFAIVYTPGELTEEEIADTIEVELEKVNDNEYNIVLEGADNKMINRFMSAELTFGYTPNDGNVAYEIQRVGDVNIIYPNDDSGKYEFNLNGTDTPDITGQRIIIGKVVFTGNGTGTFSVGDDDTAVVHTAQSADNIVDEFVPNGGTDIGTLILPGDTEIEITVPKQRLTVNVTFNNAIEDNDVAYQDMKAVISGGDLTEDITINFGTDETNENETVLEDNVYSFTQELTRGTKYTVTVSGAGYRTTSYGVTMSTDKTLNFWNNAKDEAEVVEVGNDTSAKEVTFLAGDIVKDNNINIYDLSAVVSYFGLTGLDAMNDNYEDYVKYDLNRDGKIDSKDVAYVLVSWDK